MIIGSFQSLRNEVDPEGARRHGVDVVRRISGGGAMFVEPGNTITYSLSVPEALVLVAPVASAVELPTVALPTVVPVVSPRAPTAASSTSRRPKGLAESDRTAHSS